MGRHSEL